MTNEIRIIPDSPSESPTPPAPPPHGPRPEPLPTNVEDHGPADYIEALAQESIKLQRQTLIVLQSILKVSEQMHAANTKQARKAKTTQAVKPIKGK